MKASYHFRMTKNGLTAYAAVELEAVASPFVHVTWSGELKRYARKYSKAVEEGTRDAAEWHALLGHSSASFRVVGFTELLVDTRPDAVKCAATAAAWKALGHDEGCLEFMHNGKEWVVNKRHLG